MQISWFINAYTHLTYVLSWILPTLHNLHDVEDIFEGHLMAFLTNIVVFVDKKHSL